MPTGHTVKIRWRPWPKEAGHPLFTWTFKGRRFDDHGIDLRDLETLLSIRKIIVDFAKDVWRRDNAGKPLPVRFEESIELKFFEIKPGSSQVSICERLDDEDLLAQAAQPPLPNVSDPPPPDSVVRKRRRKAPVREASRRFAESFHTIARGEDPDFPVPEDAASELRRFPKPANDDEYYEVAIPERAYTSAPRHAVPSAAGHVPDTDVGEESPTTERSRVFTIEPDNAAHLRERSEAYLQRQAAKAESDAALLKEEPIEFRGVVVSADVRARHEKAIVRVSGREVAVPFSAEQEAEITLALAKHRVTEIDIKGVGHLDPKTREPTRVTRVDYARCTLQLPLIDLHYTNPSQSSPAVPAVGTPEPTWDGPCEAMFEHLAESNPPELLRLIREGELEYYDLTFAAEVAGRIADSDAVRGALLPLLRHDEAVVREGAVYGLAAHLSTDVLDTFAAMAEADPSPGVRRALVTILEGQGRAPAAKS